MDEKYQPVVSALQERFAAELHEFRGEITLNLAAEHIIETAKTLRDEFGFNQLLDITAVDYWPQEEPRFHIVYLLRSLSETIVLRLRVPLNGNAPQHFTIEGIYPNANWLEREVFDMFGVNFSGHSDMRRIIMPYDWQGHPLRKDYPLGYEEVQYSFNWEEISLRKPSPED